MSDDLDFVVNIASTTDITNFSPEDQARVARLEREGQLFTSTILTGARLKAANDILIRHGFAPMQECSLNEILRNVTPMPWRKFRAFLEEIVAEVGQPQVAAHLLARNGA